MGYANFHLLILLLAFVISIAQPASNDTDISTTTATPSNKNTKVVTKEAVRLNFIQIYKCIINTDIIGVIVQQLLLIARPIILMVPEKSLRVYIDWIETTVFEIINILYNISIQSTNILPIITITLSMLRALFL
ncbi:uncharacterized protein LOC105185270 [Harpegnathos saltator]|uniref:uncharacterized protein LOC105185270 n=1 Tax=Harpegnathos saltator TaxID=610380 RepID=UPI00058FFE30|nr:uncharacterized protein LOC105185270 [Harpegnathos saltator]